MRYPHEAVFLAAFMILALGVPGLADTDASLGAAVHDADEIVVGRVIGVIDSKPGAVDRKPREAHWVEVIQTLKGANETGQRIAVRPNGNLWDDGGQYLLFLKRRGVGHWFEAIPDTATEADTSLIAQAVAQIHATGHGVTPEPTLWIQYEGGWGGGVLWELYITADGRFDWYRKDANGREQRLCGVLPEGVVAEMLKWVDRAGPGPQADDAGQVSIRYTRPDAAAAGKTQFKGYAMPSEPPCSVLLEDIEESVFKHSREVGRNR